MRIAVLDLGSTSFHLLVVDVDEDLRMHKVLRRRETLHLGAIVATEGRLTPEAEAEAVKAAHRLRRAADRTAPHSVVAAATHALREAANGDDLLARLEGETRCPIRLLDGSSEAQLVYEGVRCSLPVGDAPMLVCDLGGGSLEIAAGTGTDIAWDTSYPLGASLLTALMVENDPPTEAEREAITAKARDLLASAVARLDGAPRLPCFATGGTARALARLEMARWGIGAPDGLLPQGVLIPSGRLFTLTSALTTLSRRKRLAMPGMAPRRVDTLPAGAIVLASVCEVLDLGGLIVTERGLREGLVLEAMRVAPAPAASR
jgi:exopolyphosphatase/guanosine-5'-triphosphate,3'-diphosphate pyrophosphatase